MKLYIIDMKLFKEDSYFMDGELTTFSASFEDAFPEKKIVVIGVENIFYDIYDPIFLSHSRRLKSSAK